MFSLVLSHCYFHVVGQWACSLGLPGSTTGCFEFHPSFHALCYGNGAGCSMGACGSICFPSRSNAAVTGSRLGDSVPHPTLWVGAGRDCVDGRGRGVSSGLVTPWWWDTCRMYIPGVAELRTWRTALELHHHTDFFSGSAWCTQKCQTSVSPTQNTLDRTNWYVKLVWDFSYKVLFCSEYFTLGHDKSRLEKGIWNDTEIKANN